MSKPNSSLTKTCINCGLQKPLSAFLQLSGSGGATYGNICSSCRKAHQEKAEAKEPDEKTRRETGGSKIRASERLAGEVDKKEHREKLETLYREEQEKDEKQEIDRVQKIETKVKSEKIHREGYLEKSSFLNKTDKAKLAAGQEQVFGGLEQKAKEAEIRLDVPIIGTLDREKYKTALFRQYKDWIGPAAPIIGATERAQKTLGTGDKGASEKSAGDHQEKETLTEEIRKNWGPKSR